MLKYALFSLSENKTWKKFMGFERVTTVIPVQRFTN